jgi:hypothetical protein
MNAVADPVAGGENQDGTGGPHTPECGEHLDPVAAWQQPIEDDAIDRLTPGEQGQSFVPVGRGDDLVTLGFQTAAERPKQLRLVLNNQQTGDGVSLQRGLWSRGLGTRTAEGLIRVQVGSLVPATLRRTGRSSRPSWR